jgi:hypothetical protein
MVEVADRRIHGTTREQPIIRFERDERQALRPLPSRQPPVRTRRLTRRVSAGCFVDIDTIRYSVPHRHVRERVEVVVKDDHVEIWLRGQRIARHTRRLLRTYRECPDVQKLFPELQFQRELSTLAPTYRRWVQLARFDIALVEGGDLKILETNCDCPGGIALIPVINDVYRAMDWFGERVTPHGPVSLPLDRRQLFVESLAEFCVECGCSSDPPQMGFVNSIVRPIGNDLQLLAKIRGESGLRTVSGPVQSLRRDPRGKVSLADTGLDIIYQKFDASIDEDGQARLHIYEHCPSEVEAYWSCVRESALIAVNSFPSSLVAENKRVLALLRSEWLQSMLSAQQRCSIESLLPETFTLTSQSCDRSGDVRRVMARKDGFVIKKVIDTRGRGVYFGRSYDVTTWASIVGRAIDGPFVVQEYLPHEKMDVLVPGGEAKASVWAEEFPWFS